MPNTRASAYRGLLARGAFAWLLAVAISPTAEGAAQPPRPVSPGAAQLGAVTEARCPTFSWSGVAGAYGYQIAVFRVSELSGVEPALVARATVDGDARSFTPMLGQCLERGQRYAWTVAAISDRERSTEIPESELDWAPALLFEVEDAPSIDELERVIATLQRQLEDRRSGDGGKPVDGVAPELAAPTSPERALAREQDGDFRAERDARTRITPRRSQARSEGFLPGSLAAPTTATRIASPASAPVPSDDASLVVSDQIHLADASDVFKGGEVFLWDDASANTALGRTALASVSGTASHNTAFGRGALHSTTGGAYSLYGSNNTAVGDEALYSNTIGYYNTASGRSALRANTTGAFSTASGAYALSDNTTGYSNTASGAFALRANTTGRHNTASGVFVLRANTTGRHNTASGAYVLSHNTTGNRNTASGAYALFNNTTGGNNTASGFTALDFNTTGVFNTASGAAALRYNTDGNANTASGGLALSNNTTGSNNTASGTAALRKNTTGHHNTAFGNRAGYFNTTGNYNVFLYNQGIENDIGSGAIKIGTIGKQTSTFVAGIAGVPVTGAAVLVDAATGQLGVAASSRDVKRDITTLAPLTERLLALRPVSFRYRKLAPDGTDNSDDPGNSGDPDAPLEYGLVAEEVAEIFPELVIYDQKGRPQTVKYHLLSSLLLGEMQDQRDELSDQRRLAARQQTELQRLAARLEALESRPANDPERSRK